MDFTSRGSFTQQPQRAAAPEPMEARSGEHARRRVKDDAIGMWNKIGTNVLLIVGIILIALVAWYTVFATPASQSRYVDGTKLQAVFLNTGQVYFGNIKSLTKDYVVLGNVYYLQSSSSSTDKTATTSSNQNVSLVKLGCELHRPYDTMVINSAEITFWENLKADGQVAKAVAQFQQQNPNGQTCSTSSSSSGSSNPQNQASVKP